MTTTDEVIAELVKIPWFQELSPQHTRKIASITSLRHVKAGEVLFREGDHEDYLYVVTETLPINPIGKIKCRPIQGCGGSHSAVVYYCQSVGEVGMQINYQETAKDLLARIDIHQKYGARDIDQWTTEILQPQPGMQILDVGCGAGKQCFLYSDFTQRRASIVGGDLSAELLERARAENARRADNLTFQLLDFNQRFDFEDLSFDLVSSAFAIYYAANLAFTFGEAHRVLKTGGRLFVTGPLPENKRMFYDIIQEASNKPIPPMPGSSRFKGEILETITRLFGAIELLVFENPITFPAVEPFMVYVRASLSEDRRLWKSMFNGKEEYEALLKSIESVAWRHFRRDAALVMTKVVGGILATK